MCGILGVFGNLEEKNDQYNKMLASMEHRGPDDSGRVKKSRFFLGHQRLSIIDVESGHQPFQSKDGDISLICNGEIYNYRDLKRQTNQQYNFSTGSDSEVIIPAYKKNGSSTVKELDGMFSFIICEKDNYFVARDPIGIKPLYWGTDDKRLYFSSELKAMINYASRIDEFPNGYYFHPNEGLRSYYQLPEINSFVTDTDLAVKMVENSLKESVKKRLMSDVPIGVFLSGGLDSSIIAALMREEIPELHSFSVGFAKSPDIEAAKLVAEHLGTIHHEYIYTEQEMFDVLSDIIYYLESYDPALVRSAIPCYFVSKLASDFVKVILSGEGSDELFAGYSYLSDYKDPYELHLESIRILNGLHNLNLQRVDRMTMAHSIEGRVPFLDIDFIETVLNISPALKMQDKFGIEKWLLRKAFEDRLPFEIVWRDKMEFAQGCGSSTVFEQKTANITREELLEAREQSKPVSSKEELFYFNIFKDHFDHPDAENLVGRWDGNLH